MLGATRSCYISTDNLGSTSTVSLRVCGQQHVISPSSLSWVLLVERISSTASLDRLLRLRTLPACLVRRESRRINLCWTLLNTPEHSFAIFPPLQSVTVRSSSGSGTDRMACSGPERRGEQRKNNVISRVQLIPVIGKYSDLKTTQASAAGWRKEPWVRQVEKWSLNFNPSTAPI